jgi:hypothetical protein
VDERRDKKMIKKTICIILIMLMISSALVSAVNISEYTKDETIKVDITIGNFEIKNTDAGHEITVENFGRLLVPGKPNLPSKIFSIAIPPEAIVVDLDYEIQNSITIPGFYSIQPIQLPRVIGKEDPIIYEQEQKKYDENYNLVYGSDQPYPSSVVEFVRTSGYRKYNLVDVRVNPITYYPISGKLVYSSGVTVKIKYTYPEDYSVENIMIDNLPKTEKFAESIILNYDQAKNWYPTKPIEGGLYDFIIITLDSLTSSVSSLVEWETAKGRSVNVVTINWINSNYNGYDTAEKIRNFLREKFPSDQWGVTDVCIIGAYDDVPMRRASQDSGYGQPETDYYYAELTKPDSQSWDADSDHLWGEESDPIDFYNEVNVGRIPWSDPATVEHICQKSVAYELNDDESFKKNILLLGAFFWSDTDNAVLMEYKTDPAYHPWMEDWTKTCLYEDAQSTYPCDYDLNYNNVENVWSNGTYAFVNWAGHGNPDACYEYYPSQAFVDTTTCGSLNDDYPSIIFADACSNSDTDDFNIGQAMLEQGGVGFLGATKVAYGMPAWNNPNSGSSQSLDYYFTSCVTSGEYTQGQAHQFALTKMYTDNLWYYLKYETFEWGALWGNPDLTMAPVTTSNPPSAPSAPVGPNKGTYNKMYSFSSSATEPDGESIFYIFDWGDGNKSNWLGPYSSGQTVTESHSWENLGDYEIRVKAKDINGAQSQWSNPLNISIVENQFPNKPNIDGQANVIPFISYEYTFNSTDDDGDDLRYYVDWGEGESKWYGPYSSGESFSVKHIWTIGKSHTIKVKARDSVGDESEWSTFTVSLSRNVQRNLFSQIINQWIGKNLLKHPILLLFLYKLY